MLSSSTNLAADDVTITCKVRRSKYALNPEFGEVQEMTCTMRYWHPTESSPTGADATLTRKRSPSIGSDFNPSMMQLLVGSEQHDPELVLCPVQPLMGVYAGGPIRLSERFESFSSNIGSAPNSRHPSVTRSRPPSAPRSRNPSRTRGRNPSRTRGRNPSRSRGRNPSRQKSRNASMGQMVWSPEELKEVAPPTIEQFPDIKAAESQSFVIPFSDIVVVDVFGSTTPNVDEIFRDNGRLKVTTLSNGYFEFLFQTRMSYDILLAFLKANLPSERVTEGVCSANDFEIQQKGSNCCSEELFDAETLTAKRMEERVRKESISEKLRRKMTHLATRAGELSNDIVDCACGGCQVGNEAWEKRQNSPKKRFEFPEDLEFSSSRRHLEYSESNLQSTQVSSTTTRHGNKQQPKKKAKKPHTGFPDGLAFEEEVPAVEKISFEDESVSQDAEPDKVEPEQSFV